MEDFILHYGIYCYPLTFLVTLFEGESIVLVGGYLGSRGIVNVPLLITVAWLGSYLGDQIWFYLGRRFGTRIVRRFPRWQPRIDRALGLLDRYSTAFVLSFRFIYGIRNISSFAAGMSPMPWRRFTVLNFIAAGVWAVSFAGAGFAVGRLFRGLKGVLGEAAFVFGLTMLVVFCCVVYVIVKRAARRAAEPPSLRLTPGDDRRGRTQRRPADAAP